MHQYNEAQIHKLKGTGVALVTPFKLDGSVDYAALEKLIQYVTEGGVQYLVTMGTTGESATMSEQERFDVMRFTIKMNAGKLGIVTGFGGNNTAALLASIQRFDFSGVDAILSASPYYNKPTQEGIYQHYMAIDQISPVPVILYNVPGRTASNMESSTTLRLQKDSNHIVAIKEASGSFAQIMQIVQKTPATFLTLSGDDAITLPLISIGAQGVISVIANAFPEQFSSMVALAMDGQIEKAKKIHYRLLSIVDLIFAEGNPAGVKYVLQRKGIMNNHVRLPLAEISNTLKLRIDEEIEKIK
ncbi:MAG: 4-hydroxy-tetrahydrodipicolinate synthase [Sphingobacteriales bacterium BACL12 MAG-120813-bin55]|mgnify:CR=1 FL=1|jgi:4-hydroxy-tetrahydrodipicolinate synthase|nr:MAG: 4-hydroxy-tetrahydrodipicolinate synthase [Sphingobacteriales bacterium BACL12 MAG-120813-bin55]